MKTIPAKKQRKCTVMGTVFIIVAALFLSWHFFFFYREQRAIQIGKAFLEESRNEKLDFYEIESYLWPPFDPGYYRVCFTPSGESGPVFEVMVYWDLTVPAYPGK